ncbi:MAG: glycoside hydrolase family 99-like domain-containing protein [Bacteroidota bacterium]|nr:glycoside hydrolase family 99-like domain-containing protein [Bacteroidota bacterium]
MKNIRTIAMYLPQYHPIPENDEWWGKGFTEWFNVAKAKPKFKGHYQPHIPTELGFYDLRLPQVLEEQSKIAKEYGIHGFCFYHYWFNGKKLLEKPIEEMLFSKKPDFPFMLCWANESWSRAWDGKDNDIILEQTYSRDDDSKHFEYLVPYFKDPRYIRVDNKPVFIIYNSVKFPDIKQTISTWRRMSKEEGFEIYLCRFETFGNFGKSYLDVGFDAACQFPPFGRTYRNFIKDHPIRLFKKTLNLFANNKFGNIYNYKEYVEYNCKQDLYDYKIYPGIMPSWDNSPRKDRGYIIFNNSTPSLYKMWLTHIVKYFKPYSSEENFIFINAWNEWAEGNHLEPCIKWGRAYLEATYEVLSSSIK